MQHITIGKTDAAQTLPIALGFFKYFRIDPGHVRERVIAPYGVIRRNWVPDKLGYAFVVL